MKGIHLLLVNLGLVVLLGSCTTSYYAPSSHNVPMLEKKGELSASGTLSAGEHFSSAEYQLAYAATDHILGMFNGMQSKINAGNDDVEDYEVGDGTYHEFAAGYYDLLGERIILQALGGFGFGKNQYGGNNITLGEFKFNKYFIQPSASVTTNFVDFGISTRLAYLHYNSLSSQIDDFEDVINSMNNQPNSFLFEPAINLQLGWKMLKFKTQIGFSLNINNEELAQDHFNFGMGLVMLLGRRD